MDKNIRTVEEINLSAIDWNKLSIEEFHNVEQKLLANHKKVKASLKTVKRSTGLMHITLKGNQYVVKEVLYTRLKNMKSQASKDKLIEEIISTQKPLETL